MKVSRTFPHNFIFVGKAAIFNLDDAGSIFLQPTCLHGVNPEKRHLHQQDNLCFLLRIGREGIVWTKLITWQFTAATFLYV
jgi:hypothetical protein